MLEVQKSQLHSHCPAASLNVSSCVATHTMTDCRESSSQPTPHPAMQMVCAFLQQADATAGLHAIASTQSWHDDFAHVMLHGASVLPADCCFVVFTQTDIATSVLHCAHEQPGPCHATCIMPFKPSIVICVPWEAPLKPCCCCKTKAIRVTNQQVSPRPTCPQAHTPTSRLPKSGPSDAALRWSYLPAHHQKP